MPQLVEAAQQAGVVVDVDLDVPEGRIDGGVDAAAYRIVQESLTNVLRHSGATRAAVHAAVHDDHVELAVIDDGHGPAGELRSGAGLAGMRERAAVLGGQNLLRRRRRAGFRGAGRTARTGGAMSGMIRVVLVDDQELVRTGLRVLVEHDVDIEVVGEAGTGRSGVRLVREVRPDIALMDIRMPDLDGIEATRQIVANPELRDVRVLVLTTFDEDDHIFEAIRSGAAGYLLKDVSPVDLRAAIRLVAGGEALLSPSVTRTVMRSLAAAPRTRIDDGPLRRLTERERAVLEQVGRGLSNEEIARALYLSPATARTYVSRLLTKLDARDRSQLVILAYETGLISPGREC